MIQVQGDLRLGYKKAEWRSRAGKKNNLKWDRKGNKELKEEEEEEDGKGRKTGREDGRRKRRSVV